MWASTGNATGSLASNFFIPVHKCRGKIARQINGPHFPFSSRLVVVVVLIVVAVITIIIIIIIIIIIQ